MPVKEAFSAIVRLEESEVGGFGAAGAVEARLEEDIVVL